jgi:hypothetical protein
MPRYCTAIDPGPNGQPERCTCRAQPGQRFCCGHNPNPTAYGECQYFNRRGERCRAITLRGQDHCFTHSPRNRARTTPPSPSNPAPGAKRPPQDSSF